MYGLCESFIPPPLPPRSSTFFRQFISSCSIFRRRRFWSLSTSSMTAATQEAVAAEAGVLVDEDAGVVVEEETGVEEVEGVWAVAGLSARGSTTADWESAVSPVETGSDVSVEGVWEPFKERSRPYSNDPVINKSLSLSRLLSLALSRSLAL